MNLGLIAKTLILEMYCNPKDERPWAIAWSGGKDSTCTLSLVIAALEMIPKEKWRKNINVVMSDTIVENPILESYMHEQAKLLNKYVKEKELPITVDVVSRDVKQSYFVLTLGLGYPLPQHNGKNRWCTDRLKLQPQNKKLKEVNPSFIVVGTRMSESGQRAKSILKWTEGNTEDYIGDHVNLINSKTFMPIVHWSVEDVWNYLTTEGIQWSSSVPVRTLYKEATGECGFNNPKGVERKAVETCGARFGCWLCPVILNDKSTEKMSETHEWMEPLTEWRVIQMKVYGSYTPLKPEGQKRKDRSMVLKKQKELNEKIKEITKSGYGRKGQRMKDGQGCLTIEARKFLFDKLIETENLVNRLRKMEGLDSIRLISDEEVYMIKGNWNEDEEKRPFLSKNSLDIPFKDLYDYI